MLQIIFIVAKMSWGAFVSQSYIQYLCNNKFESVISFVVFRRRYFDLHEYIEQHAWCSVFTTANKGLFAGIVREMFANFRQSIQ